MTKNMANRKQNVRRQKGSGFSHIAVEVPGVETSNEWLGAVRDETYESLK